MSDLEDGLVAAKKALIDCGFCGAGEHGAGDPEINSIDRVIGALRSGRRTATLEMMGFPDAASFAKDPTQ
jgi:hypothetical protein